MCFNVNDNQNSTSGASSDGTTDPTTTELFRQFIKRMFTLSDLLTAKLIDEAQARSAAAEQQKQLDAQDYFFHSFWTGVDRPAVLDAIEKIRAWTKANPNKRRIILFLNTPGGYVLDANALKAYCEYLIGKGYEITVQVFGEAASAGSFLLNCASEGRRFLAPRSRVLIHEAAWSYEGPFAKQESEEKFNETLWMDFLAVLAERSIYKGKVQELADYVRGRDWWLTAEDAVAKGFADKIYIVDEV